jgi:UDP-N-acetylglucosamine 3-dehydrogenase
VTARLRLGVVGLGMMGRHHARVLRQLDDVDLVAVVDPAGDLHRAAIGVEVLPSVDRLLERGVDAAIVAVPTDDHERVAGQLADAGTATLVEKPLASDAATAERLIARFAATSTVAAVGHVERYNPAIRSLKARLERGDLGEIYQVTTSRQGPFPDRIKDVGVVKDLGTHDLDLTAWVAGQPYASVSARVAHRAGRPHEDLAAVVGWLRDGVVTNHLVNWVTPTKERRVTVTGARGCFVADTLAADLTFFANGEVPPAWDAVSQFRGVSEGDMVRYAISKPEPLHVELVEFLAAVRGETADIVSLADGLRTVVVADAVVESAATGRTVDLEPMGAVACG